MTVKRSLLYGGAGVALVVAAAVTAVVLLDDEPTGDDAPPASSQTDGIEPAPEPDPDTPAGDVTVPVYYLGEVTFPQGEGGETQTAFRLYREWHTTDADSAESAAAAALTRMVDAPTDPDYSTPWNQDVEVEAVSHEAGVIAVDLTGPVQAASVGAEAAELAVQQLVHTVQGALAVMDDDAATDPVQILVDGEPAGDLWGHVDASEPVARAEATGTRAPVWITTPAHGQTVSVPLTVTGVAQVFEASVSWRVLRDAEEVASGFATASEGAPAFGEFSFEVDDLEPGSYVIEAFESSAIDGSPAYVDSKGFTVG